MADFWGTQSSTATPTSSSGGFWGAQAAPAPITPSQPEVQQQAVNANKTSGGASGIGGMFKDAVSSIWSSVSNAINPDNITPKQYVDQSVAQISPGSEFSQAAQSNPFAGAGFLAKGIVDSASTSFKNGTGAVTAMLDDYKNGTGSTAGDVANLAKLAGSVAGILFSPISGAMQGAQKIPVLKQVSDALNIPFTVTGLAGSYGTGKVLDAVPDRYLSQQSKDILRQPLQDLGALAAQVVIGGKIMDKVGDVVAKGRPVTPVEAQKIVAEVKAENDHIFNPQNNPEAQAPIPHSMTHEEYAKSMGYEPIVPDEQLPVINMGAKPKDTLPTVSVDSVPDVLSTTKTRTDALASEDRAAVISRTRSLFGKGMNWVDANEQALNEFETKQRTDGKKTTIVPIDQPKFLETPKEKVPAQQIPKPSKSVSVDTGTGSSQEAPITIQKIDQPDTAAKSESGLAAGIKADAIKAGLEDSIGKIPEYARVDMKEQAALAKDLIDKNPDLAMRVARGEVDSPIPHLLPESVFTALRVVARETGDAGLFQRLAEHSNTTEMARVMGQRIKALDSGMRQDPLSIMQDIKAAREANIESKIKGTITKTKTEIADSIKTEIKKTAPKKDNWEDFVKKLECNF